MIKDNNYDVFYKTNDAALFVYKSSRKNAKTSDLIPVHHLVTQTDDRKVKDERILMQFIGTLERLLFEFKKFNGHLELKALITLNKQSEYINANNDVYGTIDVIRLILDRKCYSSFEEVINWLFNIYSLVYPYNKLSRRNIFENNSIKYMINEYYKKR